MQKEEKREAQQQFQRLRGDLHHGVWVLNEVGSFFHRVLVNRWPIPSWFIEA